MMMSQADTEHRKLSLEYLRRKHTERLEFRDKTTAFYNRTNGKKENYAVVLILTHIIYDSSSDVQFTHGVSIGTTPTRILYQYIQQAAEMKYQLQINDFAAALETNNTMQIIDTCTKLICGICCEISQHVQDKTRIEISIDQLDAIRDFWDPMGKLLFIEQLTQIYNMYLGKRAQLYHLVCMYNLLKQYNEVNHINLHSNMCSLYSAFIEKRNPSYDSCMFIFR